MLPAAGVDEVVAQHLVARVVGSELGIGLQSRLFPIAERILDPNGFIRRRLVSADGTDHFVDLPLIIDMHTHGIGNAPVVWGDIFPLGQLLFDLVILGKPLHERHLGRLLGLQEAFFVAACELCEGFRCDQPQIVVVVEKTSVHTS